MHISMYMLFILTIYMFRSAALRRRDSKKPRLRQLSANLSQSRMWRQGDSEKPRLRQLNVDLSHLRMQRQEDSKIPGLRQLSVNLSHSRIWRQGDSEKAGLRKGTFQELYCVQGCLLREDLLSLFVARTTDFNGKSRRFDPEIFFSGN